MKPGDVLLLENLRFHPEEEKNDPKFAKELMKGVDVYVDDAFAVAHRAHASVEAVTKFAPICVAGFLMRDEVHYFHKSMEDPARPLVAIIGGAKISSKLTALKNLLKHVDKLIVGGAMANTFLKAKGYEVGKSLVDDTLLEAARDTHGRGPEKEGEILSAGGLRGGRQIGPSRRRPRSPRCRRCPGIGSSWTSARPR